MQIQGMSDQQFEQIIEDTENIQYLIVKSGSMATKTNIENVLMKMYDLDRSDAHSFCNYAESRNNRNFYFSQKRVIWIAGRSEPDIKDYPIN